MSAPSTGPVEYAYMVVVPDPYQSSGIGLESMVYNHWTHMFWLKIGDSREVLSRADQYWYHNPTQKIVIIKLQNRSPLRGEEDIGPGKQLEKELFGKHRMGGMLPGGPSEWRGVYGGQDLSKTLRSTLNRFISFNYWSELTRYKLKSPETPAIQWKEVKAALAELADERLGQGGKGRGTRGPTITGTRPSPELYPMIAIIVTPNVQKGGLNHEFKTRGFMDDSRSLMTYGIKLRAHHTQKTSSFDLFSEYSRTYTPDFAYNAYRVPVQILGGIPGKSVSKKLDWLVEEGQRSLRASFYKLLGNYSTNINTHRDDWLSVSVPTGNLEAVEAVTKFLNSLVSGFNHYEVRLWDEPFPKWPDIPIPEPVVDRRAEYLAIFQKNNNELDEGLTEIMEQVRQMGQMEFKRLDSSHIVITSQRMGPQVSSPQMSAKAHSDSGAWHEVKGKGKLAEKQFPKQKTGAWNSTREDSSRAKTKLTDPPPEYFIRQLIPQKKKEAEEYRSKGKVEQSSNSHKRSQDSATRINSKVTNFYTPDSSGQLPSSDPRKKIVLEARRGKDAHSVRRNLNARINNGHE